MNPVTTALTAEIHRRQVPSSQGLLFKTLRSVVLASLAVAVLLTLLTLHFTKQRFESQAIARLNEAIAVTAEPAAVASFAGDATLARDTAKAFINHSDVMRVEIRAGGGILASAKAPGVEKWDSQPLVRTLYSPFDGKESIGEILVWPNWAHIGRGAAAEVRYTAIVLVLVTCALVAVIGLVVAFQIVRPVKSISDRLHVMDAAVGEMLAVPQGHAHSELGRLADDINGLVLRFRQSVQLEHALNLERVVSERLRLAAEVFKNSQEGIMVTDAHNRIVTVNRAFSAITGYDEGEVVGKDPRFLASGRHSAPFFETLWATLHAQGAWRGELWNRRKDGSTIPNGFGINVLRNEAGEVINYVAVFSDISSRKEAESRIEFLAHHDALTGMPNRILLRDRFTLSKSVALRSKGRIAVLFIDLDNFKHINDNWGHQAGDQFLLDTVQRLKRHVRDSDTICRQGGDEFIVMLAEVPDLDVVTRVAKNILLALTEASSIQGHAVAVSASIGVSIFPDDSVEFETLLGNADAAMYAAKESGKNSYRFFTEQMNRDTLARAEMQAQMRHALRNREFVLHYQPQIDLADGHVSGVEALVRWNHPVRGMVPPYQFISLAEESGFIIPLGTWVLEEALRQGQAWQQAGIAGVTIGVNISALQFNRDDFFDTVSNALTQSRYPAHLLELELTESVLLKDTDTAFLTIQRLKNLGVRLSIDDFGTGYSSMGYLKKINVDRLKIDQSFVRDIQEDKEDLAIVRAVIQLGRALGLNVIAEGVETKAQAQLLKNEGCHEAQGYLYGRPEHPDSLTPKLAQGSIGA